MRPETALERLGGAGGRPLLNRPDPLGELKGLFQARRLAYETADLEISVELVTPQQVADSIAERIAPPK